MQIQLFADGFPVNRPISINQWFIQNEYEQLFHLLIAGNEQKLWLDINVLIEVCTKMDG